MAKRTAKGKHTFVLSDFELVTTYDLQPARPPVFEATKVLPDGWGSATITHSRANGATALEHTYALPQVALAHPTRQLHAKSPCVYFVQCASAVALTGKA